MQRDERPTRWKFAALWNTPSVDPRVAMPAPPGRSSAIWMMRDGTRIRVADMDEHHLLSAIEMVKRRSEARRLHTLAMYAAYIDMHEDTVAADMVDLDARNIANSTDPSDFFPIYRELIRDARARGLVVDPDAITIYTRSQTP